MKTNKLSLAALTLLSVSVLLSYNSCTKNSNCNGQIALQALNPYFLLVIKNSQNQNLLDPAVTGHYDTAMIKKLNGDKVLITRPGYTPIALGFDYISNPGVKIFNLSATDQDTVSTSAQTVVQTCNTYYNLQSVKYNNVILKADSANIYVAHK